LAQYIRKFRKDKGGSGRKLPKELGAAEFTVIKCEGGRMPRYRKQIRGLKGTVPWVEGFLRAEPYG
jgi:hypothetical protein